MVHQHKSLQGWQAVSIVLWKVIRKSASNKNNDITFNTTLPYYLAHINRAGGLYGRVLTEVMSTDRTQWGLYTWQGQDSPIQTNLAPLVRILILVFAI